MRVDEMGWGLASHGMWWLVRHDRACTCGLAAGERTNSDRTLLIKTSRIVGGRNRKEESASPAPMEVCSQTS
jgi:hypothetical protein